MNRSLAFSLCAAAAAVGAHDASAHVTVASGPAIANVTQVVTFQIAHGCPAAIIGDPNLDTYSLQIEIPAGITSVRALPSAFGKVTVQKDGSGNVTSVTFTKADADVLAADDDFYTVQLRLKPPNNPFSQVYFRAHQTCKTATGTTVVDWVALPGDEGEPAPVLNVVGARLPGWNQYTIGENTHIPDLSLFFSDALIVWKGSAAYSINPATMDQINHTEGVTALTGGVHPDDVIWVKY
ncbi:MAG TPA: DUF1775 domain-containing protein [Kofleriaceae bacterium]|nr:DUF1775 domain-containing protein [Kofleriaceae bacterium]